MPDPHALDLPAETTLSTVDDPPALVYLAGLTSPHSRRNMQRYLDQIAALLSGGQADARTFDWSALRFPHVQAVRSRLMQDYAPATVNGMLSALRGVLKAAWRLGLMSAEDYQRAIDVENVKGETLPAGRDLAEGEMRALVRACLEVAGPAGVRDAAILGLLYTGGLRRAELVKVTLADYDPDSGQLRVIAGKGHKDRTVYVSNGAQDALHDWLHERGDQPGPLFAPVNKGGNIRYESDGTPVAMSAQAIYSLLKKRAEAAGVKDFSPHDLRRTFVGDLLDRGVDIVTVQKLAGHASVTTTGRYDRRPEQVKQ
ncbi:MAG: tyrosine-type recombinase/integrase [Anaerolineae bacterium]|nr:tyrosine-type recombinase/integrase [Anaerolineae bacterium]